MLVLFETSAGYSLFKVVDEDKLVKPADLYKDFSDSPSNVVSLQAFQKFNDTTEAVAAATALVESTLDKGLKKFLKKNIVNKKLGDQLVVSDSKLGGIIKDKLKIDCVANSNVMELTRGIRSQLSTLVSGLEDDRVKSMSLGLSHSLSRYKLKFSPDKVDTMIVQAINLLDELDKEINTYAMRMREWFGWHFPEMGKIVQDNIEYAKVVLKCGMRTQIPKLDFSDVIAEDVETELKATCEISMGTDISDEDIENVIELCKQVISLSEYRVQLFDYLKNRMAAIAPNLTIMVGELVGARLIAHAGSLMNLAKAPASTVQILGAEKALFRALKTKHDTPKYGLIYHASLIGQSAPKNKGKISRILAAKTSLSVRVDALGDYEGATIGYECRDKVEARLRQLETGGKYVLTNSSTKKPKKYSKAAETNGSYNEAADNTAELMDTSSEKKSKKKRKLESSDSESSDDAEEKAAKKAAKKAKKAAKKAKKAKLVSAVESDDEDAATTPSKRKSTNGEASSKKKKKKKKKAAE